jgi:WD40 repeat protein
VTTGSEGAARLWDTATGRSLHKLIGHGGGVTDAAFGPDGALVVTAGTDGTARIWDTASGRPLITLRGHTRGVSGAVFSSDGKLIVTASEDGTARIWPCVLCNTSIEDLLARARMRLAVQ